MKFITMFLLVCVFPLAGLHAQTSDRTERTRQFVVMGYEGLRLELNTRKGPYVRTLLELLNASPGVETKIVEQLKSLLAGYPNIMDFADRVIGLQAAASSGPVVDAIPAPSGPGVYSGDKLVSALEHLTRGAAVTVYLKTGERMKGTFVEYTSKRLWLRGVDRRSLSLDDILAVEAPGL